jgi:hypothetical protein
VLVGWVRWLIAVTTTLGYLFGRIIGTLWNGIHRIGS